MYLRLYNTFLLFVYHKHIFSYTKPTRLISVLPVCTRGETAKASQSRKWVLAKKKKKQKCPHDPFQIERVKIYDGTRRRASKKKKKNKIVYIIFYCGTQPTRCARANTHFYSRFEAAFPRIRNRWKSPRSFLEAYRDTEKPHTEGVELMRR